MADTTVLFISPVHGMANAAGIMHFYSQTTEVCVGIAGAATMTAEAGHAALHEHAEQLRYDILVCFGQTWRSISVGSNCERELPEPTEYVQYRLVNLFGQKAPTILLTVPSAVSSWWEDEDHVAAFMQTMEHLVSNRVVALNSNLLMLQTEEAWPWN